jgi:hypothetical protein
VDAVELDENAALHYTQIRADLTRRGAMIGANDLVIAAHARARGFTLVTNNTAEFERARDLRLENWPSMPTPRGRTSVAANLAYVMAGTLCHGRDSKRLRADPEDDAGGGRPRRKATSLSVRQRHSPTISPSAERTQN